MLGHLFKLIWNKRKRNLLLLTEIFISFLVLFAVFTLIVYCYRNYDKPMGFDYENVWVVNYNTPPAYRNLDSLAAFYDVLRSELKSMPWVREVAIGNVYFPLARAINGIGRVGSGQIEQYLIGDGFG